MLIRFMLLLTILLPIDHSYHLHAANDQVVAEIICERAVPDRTDECLSKKQKSAPIEANEKLSQAARIHAETMIKTGSFLIRRGAVCRISVSIRQVTAGVLLLKTSPGAAEKFWLQKRKQKQTLDGWVNSPAITRICSAEKPSNAESPYVTDEQTGRNLLRNGLLRAPDADGRSKLRPLRIRLNSKYKMLIDPANVILRTAADHLAFPEAVGRQSDNLPIERGEPGLRIV